MPESLQEFKAALFRVLAHEVRIRVLEELRDGERSVGDLQERLGISGPNVSQHLATLRHFGIVTARRDGTSSFYSTTDPRVYHLLDDARAIFEHQIASGAALLSDE
ncbi:MAG: metalloregulator ArsR/SmtB family transcription factor [Dehalococcoidia bacterium]